MKSYVFGVSFYISALIFKIYYYVKPFIEGSSSFRNTRISSFPSNLHYNQWLKIKSNPKVVVICVTSLSYFSIVAPYSCNDGHMDDYLQRDSHDFYMFFSENVTYLSRNLFGMNFGTFYKYYQSIN